MPIDISNVDVILADDEVTNRMVAGLQLSMFGFNEERIHECEDGQDAVRVLSELQSAGQSDPILVLLDLHMPGGMSGDTAALQIRQNIEAYARRKPFLVCCSAEVIAHLRERPWASAMHTFAAKPLLQAQIGKIVADFEAEYGH